MTKRILFVSMLIGLIFVVFLTLLLIRFDKSSETNYISELGYPICGVVSVVNLCSLVGIKTNFDDALKCIGQISHKKGVSLLDCKHALEQLGVRCGAVSVRSVADLPEAVPTICVLRSQKGLHAVVLLRRGREVLLIDGRRIKRFDVAQVDRFSINTALLTY